MFKISIVKVLFSNLPSKKGMSYVTYPMRERVNLFTVCSLRKRKFVVCPFVYGETNGSYLLANGLKGLALLCFSAYIFYSTSTPGHCKKYHSEIFKIRKSTRSVPFFCMSEPGKKISLVHSENILKILFSSSGLKIYF